MAVVSRVVLVLAILAFLAAGLILAGLAIWGVGAVIVKLTGLGFGH